MNLELQLITRSDIVKSALKIDNLYEQLIVEDFESWKPTLYITDYYFLYVDGDPFAIMAFERFCSNGLMFHGGVFKSKRGQYTPEVLKEALNQIRGIYGNKVCLTTIAVDNIPGIKMVKKAGFKEKCIINNVALNGDMMILSE